jgi:hypothetical protein
MKLFLISLLLLFAVLPYSTAQTYINCTAPLTNTTQCYNLRSDCHFDFATNRCVFNSPESCSQFYTDEIGCAQQSAFCSFSTTCVNKRADCETLVTQNTCNARSDCHWDSGTCQVGATPGSCGTLTDINDCKNDNCWWDYYLIDSQQCYNSQGEVSLLYACAHWSNYGAPNYACTSHGCDAFGNLCKDMTDGSEDVNNPDIDIAFEQDYLFTDYQVIPNTLILTFNVEMPLRLSNSNPEWTSIGIGWDGHAGVDRSFSTSSICNNIDVNDDPELLPTAFEYTGSLSALKDYYVQHIRTYGNFSFDLSDPRGVALHKLRGDRVIGPGHIITDVDIPQGELYETYSFKADLNLLLQNCSTFGVTRTVFSSSVVYKIPVAVQSHTVDGIVKTGLVFVVTVPTTGTITIGITNRNSFTVSSTASAISGDCPINQMKERLTYTLTYMNVDDPDIIVGPRNATDIITKHSPISNSLYNCYGDHVVDVYNQTCADGMCTATIVIESSCRIVTSNGNAFKTCSGALSADRIDDMGSDIPYPTNLDRIHSFWLNVYTCPLVRANNDACILTNLAPDHSPDFVVSTVSLTVYPQEQDTTTFYDVSAARLVRWADTFDQRIAMSRDTQGVNVSYSGVDLNNQQIARSRGITVIIYDEDETARATTDLHLLLDEFIVYPLDALGIVSTDGACTSLTWVQIQSILYKTSKSDLDRCPGCPTVPACDGISGCDGFAVQKEYLYQKCPAAGWAFQIGYENLPSTEVQYIPSGRRLLQYISNTARSLLSISLTGQVSFIVWANNTAIVATISPASESLVRYQSVGVAFGSMAIIALMLKCIPI